MATYSRAEVVAAAIAVAGYSPEDAEAYAHGVEVAVAAKAAGKEAGEAGLAAVCEGYLGAPSGALEAVLRGVREVYGVGSLIADLFGLEVRRG